MLRSDDKLDRALDCASVLGSLGFLHLKLKKYTESSNFLRECLRLGGSGKCVCMGAGGQVYA